MSCVISVLQLIDNLENLSLVDPILILQIIIDLLSNLEIQILICVLSLDFYDILFFKRVTCM